MSLLLKSSSHLKPGGVKRPFRRHFHVRMITRTPLFSALLQHGLLFAPRLLLAALMNERQRQASVTMRTRLVASECHLRDRFLVSHRGAAQVLDASPFRLTSEPSPHGHANHLAHDSAMVSALLDRSLASHTPCITTGQKKTGFRGRAVALSSFSAR